jgi:hypothetical protein
MKLLVYLSVLLGVSVASHAKFDFFAFESEADVFDNTKSNTQLIIAANLMQYNPGYDFNSTTMNLNEREINALGSEINLAREIKLSSTFSVAPMLGVFFNRYTKNDQTLASPDLAEVVMSHQESSNVFGAHLGANLAYRIDKSFLGVYLQPFISLSAGRGNASTKTNFNYDLTPTQEIYNVKITESFNYTRAGVGINFLSEFTAFYGQVAFYQMSFDPQNRKESGRVKLASDGAANDVNKELTSGLVSRTSSIVSVALGYRF